MSTIKAMIIPRWAIKATIEFVPVIFFNRSKGFPPKMQLEPFKAAHLFSVCFDNRRIFPASNICLKYGLAGEKSFQSSGDLLY
jgi:hypothetical protein